MPTVPPEKVATIRKALDDARARRATLTELATTHDLAAGAGLKDCANELRQHIADMVSVPRGNQAPPLNLMGDIATGIISGCLAHKLLG